MIVKGVSSCVYYKFKRITRLAFYLVCIYVCMFVCLSVSQPFASFSSFGQLLRYAEKTHCQYDEMNNLQSRNLQFEIIRCRKNVDFIHVCICQATDSTQYRPPNANLDSGCQTLSIVTGYNGCRRLSVVTPRRLCWPSNEMYNEL